MKIPVGRRGPDVRRSALYAVIVNAVQIIAVWTLAVMLYMEQILVLRQDSNNNEGS